MDDRMPLDLNVTRPARILVVDDQRLNRQLLAEMLALDGHQVEEVSGGEAALAAALAAPPDLVMLDVLMPGVDGFEVCRRLRAEERLRMLPVVIVTSLDMREDRLRGLEAGADEFLSRPVQLAELRARVRSLLRVKTLYDEVERQRAALAEWSATLEQRVAEKVLEIERLSQLKRFVAPRLAEKLLADGAQVLLTSRRREVTVLFVDLRGFSAFAERQDASVVMTLLREFHAAMGELVFEHRGTLERFTGDGMMVFFNDPDPVPDHALRALVLALALRERAASLTAGWRAVNGPEGVGFGLSMGVATIGPIGFSGRVDYAAVGSVTNRAARLCAHAPAGQVLVCGEVWADVAAAVEGGPAQVPAGKGLEQPLAAWRVDRLRPTSAPAGA
jgi:adenylate cyclase